MDFIDLEDEEFGINLINRIKTKLSITDEEQDNLLEILCEDAYNYMAIYFDNKVPKELQFIIEGVVVKRYRRLGAEGIYIEKIDVLSTTYESGDDFAEYFDIMQKYKNKSRLGFRFL